MTDPDTTDPGVPDAAHPVETSETSGVAVELLTRDPPHAHEGDAPAQIDKHYQSAAILPSGWLRCVNEVERRHTDDGHEWVRTDDHGYGDDLDYYPPHAVAAVYGLAED